MNAEILALLGLASAAIALAAIIHRRRMDVLYGPYVRGRPVRLSVKRFWQPASSAIERLSELESTRMVHLSSIGTF